MSNPIHTRILSAALISVAAFVGTTAPLPADAGAISRACLASGRAQANPGLCGCIQQVADMTLSGSDQRRAAKFFADPHQAQEIRQSDNRGHEAFWQRYKTFGATAANYCG